MISLGDRVEAIERERLLREGLELEGAMRLTHLLPEAGALLRPGALRILLSDFHFPHDAGSLVRALRPGPGGGLLVQVLSKDDAEPEPGRALRLVDAETDEALDLVVDEGLAERYRERTLRLRAALEDACVVNGASFLSLPVGEDIDGVCRASLARRGVLAVV